MAAQRSGLLERFAPVPRISNRRLSQRCRGFKAVAERLVSDARPAVENFLGGRAPAGPALLMILGELVRDKGCVEDLAALNRGTVEPQFLLRITCVFGAKAAPSWGRPADCRGVSARCFFRRKAAAPVAPASGAIHPPAEPLDGWSAHHCAR